jgi:hypothetical protein
VARPVSTKQRIVLIDLHADSSLHSRWHGYVDPITTHEPDDAAGITWWLLNGSRLLLAVSTRIFATVDDARADLAQLQERAVRKALPWNVHSRRFLLLTPLRPGGPPDDPDEVLRRALGVSVRSYSSPSGLTRDVEAATRSLQVGEIPDRLTAGLAFPGR